MARLTLNCPTCRRQLVHVPLGGLTLHYRCDEHGLLIWRPLVIVSAEEHADPSAEVGRDLSHDAA